MSYKIIKAIKMNGEIIKYEVQNLENEEIATIRIRQIADFQILKEFENAIPKETAFSPKGKGFEVVEIDALSVEERKERARLFAEELMETQIRVTGSYEKYIGESPRKYLLSALGQVGEIGIYPGTEYFNKGIVDCLKFPDVQIGENTSICPSNGCRQRYYGWNTNVPEVRAENTDKYFTIDHKPYSLPLFLTEAGVNAFDIFYVVQIKGNINCNVWISKDNKILFVSAYKK